MALPVWTSTKNKADRDSENSFIESYKDLTRIATQKMDELDPSSLDMRATFGAETQLSLPKSWIERNVPKALSIAESGLDLSLRHIMVTYQDGILKMQTVTRDKTISFKTNLEMDPEYLEGRSNSFKMAISCEQLRAMYDFLSKTFGLGRCDIGAKIGTQGMCESLLICCYSPEADDNQNTERPPRDVINPNADEQETAAEQNTKAALFKLSRSVGEMPLLNLDKNSLSYIQKYSATVRPTLRWAFSNKREYIELIAKSGILEIQFQDEKSQASVRASLGAPLTISGDSFDDMHPIASVNGNHISDIFSFIKDPINFVFGFVEGSDGPEPTPIFLENDEIEAAIAQSYSEGTWTEVKRYITHRKGKVVDSTEKEATERALKQNKAKLEIPDSGVPEGATPIVTAKPKRRRSTARRKDPTSVAEVLAPEAAQEPKVVIGKADEVSRSDSMNTVTPGDLEHRMIKMEDTLSTILELLVGGRASSKSRIEATSEVSDALKRPVVRRRTNAFVYDTDAIGDFLLQRPGKEITMHLIKESLPQLKTNNVYHVFHRLETERVVSRTRKGVYQVPEDIESKFREYRNRFFKKDLTVAPAVLTDEQKAAIAEKNKIEKADALASARAEDNTDPPEDGR